MPPEPQPAGSSDDESMELVADRLIIATRVLQSIATTYAALDPSEVGPSDLVRLRRALMLLSEALDQFGDADRVTEG